MRSEYLALRRLSESSDYRMLEAIWMHHVSKIEQARDRAASRGQESAWRYAAGQEKGAKLIMTALQAAIVDMESKEEGLADEEKYDSLLKEIRGETK